MERSQNSKNPNIFAEDTDPVEIAGILDRKDEMEDELTKLVRSRRLARQESDPNKKGANNDDETVEASAKVDFYPKANEAAEAETIDTDN